VHQVRGKRRWLHYNA